MRAVPSEWVVETTNLCKRYGRVEAVRDLNLRVAAGRITGFLGRNGSGKSSTIKSRRPRLLILDEPSEGLDPVSIEDVLRTLRGIVSSGTSVFSRSSSCAWSARCSRPRPRQSLPGGTFEGLIP
jgi:ABC-type multidrug transport system ATPase subunit